MSLILGIGLRESANLAAFLDAISRLAASAQQVADCPVALPAFRSYLPLVQTLRQAGREILLIPAEDLQGVITPSQSPRSLAQYGTGSVAEACALVATGPGRLVSHAITSSDRSLTAALARRESRASLPSQPQRPFS